jgi:hypothetical protein
VRTQGRRPETLEEALTCLAAQTVPDVEVKLAVHDPSPAQFSEVEAQVRRFAPSFSGRVEVFEVRGGTRARPLNAGLERATGSYAAFLDDDDLVAADWAEAFADGAAAAPGQVVRSSSVNQRVSRVRGGRDGFYLTLGPPERVYPTQFDLIEHLHENATPIFSYAVPLDSLRREDLRFSEDLPVLEDWDFLLRVALLCGVHDTGRTTGIYHWWESGESALSVVPVDDWQRARERVLERLNAAPIALPPGSGARLVGLVGDLRWSQRKQADLELQLAAARRELAELQQSHSWRITGPLRWLSRHLRHFGPASASGQIDGGGSTGRSIHPGPSPDTTGAG